MLIIDCVHLELYTNEFGSSKDEEKLHLGVREQKRLNTNALVYPVVMGPSSNNNSEHLIMPISVDTYSVM
jgi:hypothetical protein